MEITSVIGPSILTSSAILYSTDAADHGHLEVVQVLLDAGAKADVSDHDQWTPLQASSI